ncbi:MAG: tetratricopeptide repeat protein [Candidatus Heimdallarchaeota archaeon]|nr:tetratricopeptide repeat protein [Candidatus Heimdallarchaeota archaeon]MCK4289826.1 tetratricopeptide repeat protein [Candidatus Heimdallarchaeota archaeon]
MSMEDREKRNFLMELTTDAQSLMYQGKKEEALECYDKILVKYPDDTTVIYGKGMIYFEFDDLEEAITCFNKAIEIYPEDVDSLYAKGAILSSIGQNDEAIELFDTVLKHDTKFVIAWLAKGYALLNINKSKKALQCFVEVEKLGRKEIAFSGKGHALRKLNELEKSEKSYQEAIVIDPYDPEALFGLGIIAYKNEKLKLATKFLYRSVIQDDDNLEAWETLAEIYKKTKDAEKEKAALAKISELKEK